MGNVVNSLGVPLAAQRSDDWVLEETPVKVDPPPGLSEDAARRHAGNRLRQELERADRERRLREAEAIVAELKPRVEADARRKEGAERCDME
jgi:hypothetical protein